MNERSSAPSWLYSFVDLAFLLVIALSLMELGLSDVRDLSELEVPYVHASDAASPMNFAGERWQLRVHARAKQAPFELAAVGSAPPDLEPGRLARVALATRLEGLQQSGARKPLLAPHEDSRSADLLEAVALLETYWPTGRPVLVAPAPE